MPLSMTRGKNQILYNYLPERTIEFPKGAAIGLIKEILGTRPHDLNYDAVAHRVAAEARAWREEWRPSLRDQVLDNPNRFELVDPESARSELFPKVFWCQNRACGRVLNYQNSNRPPGGTCQHCSGQLVQMRFVKVHTCGHLEPLTAPPCNNCSKGESQMALDTRGSERMTNFRWVCRACGKQTNLFAGYCPTCPSSLSRDERFLDIQLHRAGKTYYPHTTTLLNIPHGQLQGLFARPQSDWAALVGSIFLTLPEVINKRLVDLAGGTSSSTARTQGASVSADELARLTAQMQAGEITPQKMTEQIQRLTRQAQDRSTATNPSELRSVIVDRTGVPSHVWTNAGYDLLESVLSNEGVTADMFGRQSSDPTRQLATRLGFEHVELLNDFPVVTATYGYSRVEYGPNRARLNPFPPDRRHGRFPISSTKCRQMRFVSS